MSVRTHSCRGAKLGLRVGIVLATAATLLVVGVASADVGELAGQWWNWAEHERVATHVVMDETGQFGDLNQQGDVWFLAGNFGGTTVRTLSPAHGTPGVPPGKALFFPLLTYGAWEPTDGTTEEELRGTANFFMDLVPELEASVDGVPLQNLFDYRAESPAGGFQLEVPAGSRLTELPDVGEGLEARDHLAVADGYWLMLEPLDVGDHVISFRGVLGPPGEDPWFSLDVTYDPLTVVPEPSSIVMLTIGAFALAGCGRWRRRRAA